MTIRRIALALLATTACAPSYHQRLLSAPESPSPAAAPGYLRAGFARLDFTPPPGVGLAGNGPEGLRSDGWRLHLFARALVLEDPTGERMAFVIADLPSVSPSLHRGVAALVAAETGIGADRLIVSATHTHAGPGHFYSDATYNDQASRVTGYDPEVERLLVGRMAAAVRTAARSLRHAWAGWSIDSLEGVTRNRSLTPYCRNPRADLPEPCPWPAGPEVPDPMPPEDSARFAGRAVSKQLAVLRIDTLPPALGSAPAGFLSVFAIHGTGNSNASTLLDGDIQGLVMARLERGLLAAGSRPGIGLFVNGAEGDVSPALDAATRCPRPALGPVGPVNPVRGIPLRYDFVRGSATAREDCLRFARREIERVADTIATAIQTRLAALRPDQLNDQLMVRRAFTTLHLPTDSLLCPAPIAGTAAVGGAEDAPTRIWKWEPLAPFYHLRLHEGGGAVDRPPHGCQGAKHRVGPLQDLFVGEHGLPEYAQLTVVRVGRVALGAVPAEVTTIAARRMRQAIAAGVGGMGEGEVAMIGLANGFLQYINTASEYGSQSYEGGSNLYGPGSAAAFARTLGELAASVSGHRASPAAVVPPIVAYPGKPREIMPDSVSGIATIGDRALKVECRRGAVRATWRDLPPGRIPPWRGEPMVRFVEADGTAVGDGDPAVAIRVLGKGGSGSTRWEATWLPERAVRGVRVVLPGYHGRPAGDVTLAGDCGTGET